MNREFSSFERRMSILSILMNQKLISRLELARIFCVSGFTIGDDISALSRVATMSVSCLFDGVK